MQRQKFASEKDIRCWCSSVIHHAAIRAKKRRTRWAREELILNRPITQGADEELIAFVPCVNSGQAFKNSELHVLLKSLPPMEFIVLDDLYLHDLSQKETALHLHISQQQVSRLKNRALSHLKRQMIEG